MMNQVLPRALDASPIDEGGLWKALCYVLACFFIDDVSDPVRRRVLDDEEPEILGQALKDVKQEFSLISEW